MGRDFRITGGPGVRTEETPRGTIISFDGRGFSWIHPFRVSLVGTSCSITPGEVNGVPPLIGKVPLDDGPRLDFPDPELDAAGRGYIALEITCGKKWEVLSAKIVQVASLDDDTAAASTSAPVGYRSGAVLTLPGRRARHGLARLRRQSNGLLRAVQFTQTSLDHRVFVLDEAKSLARHFFFPAA